MTTAKSGGRSILMCNNSKADLNLTVGRDVVVKKVIFAISLSLAGETSLISLLFQTDFEWKDSERASVLGSFFWLHWALQLPGGLLARQFGAKCIFGLSNLFMFAMSMLMPVLARWDIKGLIVARVLQGFVGVSAAIDFSHLRINWWLHKYQVYTGVRFVVRTAQARLAAPGSIWRCSPSVVPVLKGPMSTRP